MSRLKSPLLRRQMCTQTWCARCYRKWRLIFNGGEMVGIKTSCQPIALVYSFLTYFRRSFLSLGQVGLIFSFISLNMTEAFGSFRLLAAAEVRRSGSVNLFPPDCFQIAFSSADEKELLCFSLMNGGGEGLRRCEGGSYSIPTTEQR